jgi:hypothetical protein
LGSHEPPFNRLAWAVDRDAEVGKCGAECSQLLREGFDAGVALGVIDIGEQVVQLVEVIVVDGPVDSLALAALIDDEHPLEISMAAVAHRAGVFEPTLSTATSRPSATSSVLWPPCSTAG